MTMNRALKWVTAPMLATLLLACQSQRAQLPVEPRVGPMPSREQTVSQSQLLQATGDAYARLIDGAAADGVLDQNPALKARLGDITRRLIAASGALRADAPDWPWDAHLIDRVPLDAWCLPGGKIVVYSPLVTRLGLDDDEFAALLAHAMAHALRGHTLEQAQAGSLTDSGGLDSTSAAVRPYSRAYESEADRLGVELAARAGYSPHAAAGLWRKATALAGTGVQVRWLINHPWIPTRQDDLEAVARRVMPLYDQAKKP